MLQEVEEKGKKKRKENSLPAHSMAIIRDSVVVAACEETV